MRILAVLLVTIALAALNAGTDAVPAKLIGARLAARQAAHPA